PDERAGESLDRVVTGVEGYFGHGAASLQLPGGAFHHHPTAQSHRRLSGPTAELAAEVPWCGERSGGHFAEPGVVLIEDGVQEFAQAVSPQFGHVLQCGRSAADCARPFLLSFGGLGPSGFLCGAVPAARALSCAAW